MAFSHFAGTPRFARRWRFPVLCAFLLALTACSVVKVAYNNVDVYLGWKADDYFGLDGEQKALLHKRLDATLRWHRSEELPQYAAAFVAAGGRVGGGLTEADIEWFVEFARVHYEALARHSAPGAAEVLSSLSPAQVTRFETKLRRDNDRFAEEYVELSPETQRTKRYESTVETMEEWVGPLSEAQRARIEALSFAIPLTGSLRLSDRQRRQRELIAILRRDRAAPMLAPELEAWLIDWDKGRTPEYDRLAQEARRRTVTMVLELDRSLTSAQRLRAQHRLSHYADEFRALANSTPVNSARASLRTPAAILSELD